jgi:hypothetical protein
MAEVADVSIPPVMTPLEETEVAEKSAAETVAAEKAVEKKVHRFSGSPRNLVPGMALLLAAGLAFSMNMTDVFFARAIAWTFAIWGLMLVYSGLLDLNETYTVTDEGLEIKNVMTPWDYRKMWEWAYINRLDIKVKRAGGTAQDRVLSVYYMRPPELSIYREDRVFDPELARLVIENAGLRSAGADNPGDIAAIATDRKATYTWTR